MFFKSENDEVFYFDNAEQYAIFGKDKNLIEMTHAEVVEHINKNSGHDNIDPEREQ